MIHYSVINRLRNNASRIVWACVVGVILISCASIGSPGGGDYDFDPPVMLRSTPEANGLNVKGHKVEIIFDELVQVEKAMDKVIITPPQKNLPIIRAQNNKVIVELRDTLIPNTTYTIDFTDAIVDNNEKNTLENFALSFSTGNVIDSLGLSGSVLTADNLEPVAGIYVGIHSDLSDTAFTKFPFERISRTNDLGRFTIKGIAPGKYKIYALNDLNRDYKYDNPEEEIAFLDSVFLPRSESAIRYDSVFNKKTLLFDSLREISYTRFIPDDIVLRSFTSSFKRQYLQKHERVEDDQLNLYFGAPTTLPTFKALNTPLEMEKWSVLERSAGNDTLKYWIVNPDVIKMDTIALKVSYFVTDTLNLLQAKTDTLKFVNRNKNRDLKQNLKQDQKKNKKKNAVAEKIPFLEISNNIKADFDIYNDINIEFKEPPINFEKEKIHLQQRADSTFNDIEFRLIADTLNTRKYALKYDWEANAEYRLLIDSCSFETYNGLKNKEIKSPFKIKRLDQYGQLKVFLENLPEGVPSFMELLNKSDVSVRKVEVVDGIASFINLDPGIYYARLTVDTNGNGKWDTGDFSKGIEPELVVYYNKTFEIKAFWDIEEDWDILSVPIDKQKPLDITKNKPKEKENRRKQMQKEDARSKNSSSNTQRKN